MEANAPTTIQRRDWVRIGDFYIILTQLRNMEEEVVSVSRLVIAVGFALHVGYQSLT